MRRLILMLATVLPMIAFAQGHEGIWKQTKFEKLTSQTGSLIKFTDISVPNFPLYLGGAVKAYIRTCLNGGENVYFYRIEQQSVEPRVAMIEYSDLVEVNKAIEKMVKEITSDIQGNYGYLENRFMTEDGFLIGYRISKEKVSWFLKFGWYDSVTVVVKNHEALVSAFRSAQQKIEELKNGMKQIDSL